ncbi:MAG: short chain dehydrogenase, partial [Xanthobacteraceae bacterium]
TAAIQFVVGGEAGMRRARKPEIMADAAYAIVTKPSRTFTGNFLIDDSFLYGEGERDFDKYAVDPKSSLMRDFFVPDDMPPPPGVSLAAKT